MFSNDHSAMYLIDNVINLNSFFKATGITKSSYISIFHKFKMGQNKPFTAVLPYEKKMFIKYIKLVAQENIQIIKNSMLFHCCEHRKVNSSVTDVFTNYFL